MIKIIDIILDNHFHLQEDGSKNFTGQSCDFCTSFPMGQIPFKQIQKGIKIYFSCMFCWNKYQHSLIRGRF